MLLQCVVSVNCPVSSTTQYMSWGELIVYDGHVCRCVYGNHKQIAIAIELNFPQPKQKVLGSSKVYKPAVTRHYLVGANLNLKKNRTNNVYRY